MRHPNQELPVDKFGKRLYGKMFPGQEQGLLTLSPLNSRAKNLRFYQVELGKELFYLRHDAALLGERGKWDKTITSIRRT